MAEVLGALSVGERLAHRRAQDAVALAPDDRTRRGQQHVADREGDNAALISARLRELGSEDMEEPFRPFFEAFRKAIGGEVDPYSPTTAQATEVLLDAIAASDGTRASVTEELLKVRVEDGILGSFEFDENGDRTAAAVTMYRIENGKPRVRAVITLP